MALHFTFLKIEPSEAIKKYAEKKIEKFKKYVSYPMEIHTVLSVQRGKHSAEITCHAEHRDLVAIAKTDDLYESIDAAVVKIETQMKKEREKKKGHTAGHKISRKNGKLAKDVKADLPHQAKPLR